MIPKELLIAKESHQCYTHIYIYKGVVVPSAIVIISS